MSRRELTDAHHRDYSHGRYNYRGGVPRGSSCIPYAEARVLIGEVLSELKVYYPSIQKLLYAILVTYRQLRHYFDEY